MLPLLSDIELFSWLLFGAIWQLDCSKHGKKTEQTPPTAIVWGGIQYWDVLLG